jgi:hypothetical protein
LAGRLKEMAAHAGGLRALQMAVGTRAVPDILTPVGWRKGQDQLLLDVANDLLLKLLPGSAGCRSVDLVDAHCPGLSTAFRSLHLSLWAALSEEPREPQDSDFADAVHSMYAPYVTLFRADRYMAPYVEKQVHPRGGKVVSRLDELPGAVENLLAHGSKQDG